MAIDDAGDGMQPARLTQSVRAVCDKAPWQERAEVDSPEPNVYPTDMDWLTNLIWHDGQFLGIAWSFWKALGWLGNAVFFSRFFVQWYATEKLKRVVVPTAFWWLSLLGSLLLLIYSLHKQDSVFIFAYLFTWIPYIRNLIIHRRHEEAHLDCPECREVCPPHSKFCLACGAKLVTSEANKPA